MSRLQSALALITALLVPAAFAAPLSRACAQRLAPTDVINTLTTVDPVFRPMGVPKHNTLDGLFCVAKVADRFLQSLGRGTRPDVVLGAVCAGTGSSLRNLAAHVFDDDEVKAVLKAAVHWISEDEGYDDGYDVFGPSSLTGRGARELEVEDLLDANRATRALLLKTTRWVVLRRVIIDGPNANNVFAQVEDPDRTTLRSGRLIAAPDADAGWRFTDADDPQFSAHINAALGASLGFDDEDDDHED